MIDIESTVLAVIPARGGSKGIPGKNLVPVHGRPLLGWTIETVRKATEGLFLVVTTDDPAIAEYAISLGALVVDRPAELATDLSPTEPAVLHVLDALMPASAFEAVMLLQATSPVRRGDTIDRALAQFRSSQVDSLVGVVEVSPFVWRGPRDDARALYDVDARPRRQDLVEADLVYRECGSIYVTRTGPFRATGNRICGRVGLVVLDSDEGIDIDTPYDLKHAEQVLASLNV